MIGIAVATGLFVGGVEWLKPPALFDKLPIVKTIIIPAKDPHSLCSTPLNNPDGTKLIEACATLMKDGSCFIIVPIDRAEVYRWILLHHELANCNGWRHPK